ncbi:MAG: LptF/LptG family permease [Bacillota bacterium]
MKLKWSKRIVDKYIFKQVLYPFLMGILLIKVIMLSGFLYEMTDLIIMKDIPVPEVLELLFYQMPEIIVETFPMAILFGTIYGLGSLNRENEFTALRMGGISLYRLVIPLVILGVIFSGFTYLLNEEVVPWANHRAQNIVRLSVLKQSTPDVEEDVFFEGPEGRMFFVNEFNDKTGTAEDIIIFNNQGQTKYPEVITARRAETRDNIWRLEEGVSHTYDQDGNLDLASDFEVMEVEVARDITSLYGKQRTPREMSREELRKEIKLFRDSGIEVDSLMVDYHRKLAIPFIPLIFILIGAPLSLGKKNSRAAGIVFTIVIIFLYYFLQSVFRSLGRNSMIPPLIAAWLPNIIFFLVGLVLIFWQTSKQNWGQWSKRWEKIKSALNPTIFFAVVFVLIFISVPAVGQSEILNLEAGKVTSDTDGIQVTGDIKGQHKNIYLRAEQINIIREDGTKEELEGPQKLNIKTGKISGCDGEQLHYYFQAREATIYPDDYLTAKHVTFYELSGELPLFYWPYLYLSLKEEDEGIIPTVGYDGRRGWFLKTIYNYNLQNGQQGSLYLDYFTKTGFAGGFEHFLIHEKDQKSSVYYYNQQNRIDLPGLFDWQASFMYSEQGEDWETDMDFEYTVYDDQRELNGYADLEYDNPEKVGNITLESEFLENNYFENPENDERTVDIDFAYGRDFADNWMINLNYARDYKMEPGEETAFRWRTENFIQRSTSQNQLEIIMERYDPEYAEDGEDDENGEDDEVDTVYYRWPEINYEHYLPYNFNYYFSLGRYREEGVEERADRMSNKLNYKRTFPLREKIDFDVDQSINHRIFRLRDREGELLPQLSYQGQLGLDFVPGDNSNLNLTHNYSDYLGAESPLNFDQIRHQNKFLLNYSFSPSSWDVGLKTGYDLIDSQYDPLAADVMWQVIPSTQLGLETEYDIENKRWDDLVLSADYTNQDLNVESELEYDLYQSTYRYLELIAEYKKNYWKLNTGLEHEFRDPRAGKFVLGVGYDDQKKWEVNSNLKYDYLEQKINEWDNQLVYELEDEWYVEFLHSYERDSSGSAHDLETVVKKNFHCRELWFSYDHQEQQFSVEYVINLLPDHGFEFGIGEDRDLSFDLGVRELLED